MSLAFYTIVLGTISHLLYASPPPTPFFFFFSYNIVLYLLQIQCTPHSISPCIMLLNLFQHSNFYKAVAFLYKDATGQWHLSLWNYFPKPEKYSSLFGQAWDEKWKGGGPWTEGGLPFFLTLCTMQKILHWFSFSPPFSHCSPPSQDHNHLFVVVAVVVVVVLF